jgi:acetamidase/formamidase
MDLRQLEPGAAIVLPVLVEGGLLYVGDLHAAMGEGEPAWVGLESAGTAVLRVSVLRGAAPPFPRLLLPGDRTGFTAVHGQPRAAGPSQGDWSSLPSPHDAAMQDAVGQAYDHLVAAEGLTPEEAFGFLSAEADARFGGPASRQALVIVPSPKAFLK